MTADMTSWEETLAQLRSKYLVHLKEQMFSLEEVCRLLEIRWSDTLFTEMQREIHNIKGTSGTYGFFEIHQHALELEQAFKCLTQKDVQTVDAMVRSLNEAIQKA